jgi:hypothetical protein
MLGTVVHICMEEDNPHVCVLLRALKPGKKSKKNYGLHRQEDPGKKSGNFKWTVSRDRYFLRSINKSERNSHLFQKSSLRNSL